MSVTESTPFQFTLSLLACNTILPATVPEALEPTTWIPLTWLLSGLTLMMTVSVFTTESFAVTGLTVLTIWAFASNPPVKVGMEKATNTIAKRNNSCFMVRMF